VLLGIRLCFRTGNFDGEKYQSFMHDRSRDRIRIDGRHRGDRIQVTVKEPMGIDLVHVEL